MTALRLVVLSSVGWLMVCPVFGQAAEEKQLTDLDQLLEAVRSRQQEQQAINARRERDFLADKQVQQELLAEARRAFEMSQRENQPLLSRTEAGAAEIARLEQKLEEQVRSMGDIAGTFHEFAGDFAAVVQDSMVTAELPLRDEHLRQLAVAGSQPTIEDIQEYWLLLQQEMTEAARVGRFEARIVAADGTEQTEEVIRIGTFTALGKNGFLRFIPETGELLELSRQPAARYRNAANDFFESAGLMASAVVDPTRGNLLGIMGYSPGPAERIEQGGPIARIILALGALGLLITLWRAVHLLLLHLKVRGQLRKIDKPLPGNPLGRVMLAARTVSPDDNELLQLKLDEAILSEVPMLERGIGLIKMLAAIAPLLGLLGTVTGMIITFQSISLFGTGDPKLMAGGISQALVTTVLGLIVAIPLLFGHSLVSSLAQTLVQRLDEQSAGVLARSAEQREKP